MKQVVFGKTDLLVSEMCLGTMMFGDRCSETEADRILSHGLEQGINFLDTAAMYCDGRTEEMLGRLLQGRRHRFVLASKVHKGLEAEAIISSLEESLRRLQTDYLDLYLIHWPKPGMRLEEVMRALDHVGRQGKARWVGCCNYPAYLFVLSNAVAAQANLRPFDCLQIPYNLIERGAEVEVLPMAHALGVAVMAYRPLAMGLLTGRYAGTEELPADSRAVNDERIGRWLAAYSEDLARLAEYARQNNLSLSDVALAWLRASPAVTCPVVGVSSLAQLQACLSGFALELEPQERELIGNLLRTEVREEAGGAYKALRRNLTLVSLGGRAAAQ
ncbi:MAG: aldo/keto reductase [candidate division KSB1 bacterium]|nr:aldo/keto reductase [candidate division KSB1 bacterium]MDZ7275179.1 aldo/keto reductase [candidate division KSB1 bacterium]MDZ7287348.1 aldo/keto reductase [candidate division KSB1 bacterium]MDZ7299462.1 aldo/keto reductase [candidate division KSB1 bacterium]MDZ7305492.1 aldo/keto reductase [candidate division KSB1 bacterium]